MCLSLSIRHVFNDVINPASSGLGRASALAITIAPIASSAAHIRYRRGHHQMLGVARWFVGRR